MALLAQVSSVAGQNTAVFVAPFDGVILRSVLVNNRDGSATTFKLAFMRTLGDPASANWTHFDTPLPANDTYTYAPNGGLHLQNGATVVINAPTNTVNCHLFGDIVGQRPAT